MVFILNYKIDLKRISILNRDSRVIGLWRIFGIYPLRHASVSGHLLVSV